MDIVFEPAPRPPSAFWLRWRATLVTLPLIILVMTSAAVGGWLLLAQVEQPVAVHSPTAVVCWDGDERPRSECGLPHGVQGLRWVFPSFSPFSGRCERTRFPNQGVPRPLEFVCTERVAGEEVRITYTRRTSVKRGLAYIASTYPDIDPARSERGELVTFRAPSGGDYRLTRVFQRYPFSVEIVASTKPLRERALAKTVETRRVSQISVR